MKVIKAFPPIWPEIAKVFPVKGRQGILYAYGTRLFNPSGITIPWWLMEHEKTHCRQQMAIAAPGGPDMERFRVDSWWHLYLTDPTFRLQQELEAHIIEFSAYQAAHPGEWHSNDAYLDMISKRLASPLYGNLDTEKHVRELILVGSSHE